MRKIVLFCTFMVYALFMNAQTPSECATPDFTDPDLAGVYSGAIDLATLDLASCEPLVLMYFSGELISPMDQRIISI